MYAVLTEFNIVWGFTDAGKGIRWQGYLLIRLKFEL